MLRALPWFLTATAYAAIIGETLLLAGLFVVLFMLVGHQNNLQRTIQTREANIAAYQRAFRAVAESGRVRAADLDASEAEYVTPYGDEQGWVVEGDAPADTTDFDEIVLVFDAEGRLTGAHAYKP